MELVPLNVISTYSLLQSPLRPQELVQGAKAKGYHAVALADWNVMYGAIDFYNAAKAAGIKPLLGLRLHLKTAAMTTRGLEVLFLARTQAGYLNLMQLSTLKQTQAQTRFLTHQEIKPYLNDLDLILPAQPLTLDQSLIDQWLPAMIEATAGHLWLGVDLELDAIQREQIKQTAQHYDVSLAAAPRVEYLEDDDAFAADVLRHIDAGTKMANPFFQAHQSISRALPEQEKLSQAFLDSGFENAVEQTTRIAQECAVEVRFQKPVLPKFPTPDQQNAADYLKSLCQAGLQKRPLAPGYTLADYQRRLQSELTTIHEMGFDDYFLIVWDVMRFVHQQKMATDPGRGSAAGSLVAYVLAITEVDPLKYQLLFERFLNPERAQMPDIDLDLPDNRRDEVLAYVHQKYGHSRVAQIITFGTFGAKQAVRDVGRVFGMPVYAIDELARAVPNLPKITLQQALNESRSLNNLLSDSSQNALLMKTALRIEGLPRHYSTHAAGIVLSQDPLNQLVPLQNGSDGLLMTQFPKDTVEALGLLKMDFLGLRNLSIMDAALRLVEKSQPDFNLRKISLNDPLTLQLFQKGATEGIFQFESSGIRQVLIRLHPENFEMIVAVNALYRPGPMDNITHFIARKEGREKVSLPDPSLAPILAPTYGILVYQEQVMQLAAKMAGFTLGQADLLRRAMSKKKQDVMEKMRGRFVQGAIANGYSKTVAEQVFDYIDRFANYGFNRSHAVAYSMMAFEMAYLKCHFAPAFFAALLNAHAGSEKMRAYFEDARSFGVAIIGPNINFSQADFSLYQGRVLFGLAMIKGIRRDLIKAVIDQRKQKPFANLADFIGRIDVKFRKVELIAPLIYAGAFDHLGSNRAEMIDALPDLIDGAEFNQALMGNDTFQTTIPARPEYPLAQRLEKEHEYLGIYLSGHPVSQYRALANQLHAVKVTQLKEGMNATLILYVSRVKTINTKKTRQPMAFISASDETGSIEVTVFPKQFQRYQELIAARNVLIISGRVENRNGSLQLLASRIQLTSTAGERGSAPAKTRWFLQLRPGVLTPQLSAQLQEFIKLHHGNVPVMVYYPEKKQTQLLPRSQWLNGDEATKKGLIDLLGVSNVVYQSVP